MNSAPIGVFDSGVGGLSLILDLRRLLPNEDFIYYGDRANAPYGSKTPEEILEIWVEAKLEERKESKK